MPVSEVCARPPTGAACRTAGRRTHERARRANHQLSALRMHRRAQRGDCMSARRWWLYGLWTAVVMAVYLFIPSVTLPAFLLIAGTNVTAILIGVRRNRPRRRLPWLLLAFSNLTFAAGTITAVVLQEILHQTAFPSIADAIFLGLCFPTLLLSLLSLTRSGAVLRDRATMIDGLILTAGAGFLSWTFLIGPYLANPQLTLVEKVIQIAYPLCDVLVLAILSRLAIGAKLSWSVVLLIGSGVGLLKIGRAH